MKGNWKKVIPVAFLASLSLALYLYASGDPLLAIVALLLSVTLLFFT